MEILVMCFKGPKVLNLVSCFQRTKDFLGFGSGPRIFWALAHVFRGPKIFGSWLIFLKD